MNVIAHNYFIVRDIKKPEKTERYLVNLKQNFAFLFLFVLFRSNNGRQGRPSFITNRSFFQNGISNKSCITLSSTSQTALFS